uniref:Uncharacterized protein n=1 Tax=viral metagenome TaxID=1070528 RepID=A0A6C0I5Y3_9ZZZZ
MQDADKSNGIVLCGVCKNAVNTLPVIRAAFEDLASKAGVPCWAVFYENNSDDGTDRELMKWASEAPDQVRVQCDKFTQEEELSRCVARTYDNRPCRMEQIAFARNKLLAMLSGNQGAKHCAPHPSSGNQGAKHCALHPSSGNQGAKHCAPHPSSGNQGSPARYVVMIDMDNPVPFPVNAVLNCIARDPDGFDALICNGLNPMGYMYDTYAYRDAQFPFGPEIMREAFWSGHHQFYVQTAMHNKTLLFMRQMKHNPALLPYIPVASGFNGLCIFRWEAIMGGMRPPYDPLGKSIDQPLNPLRYSAVPTPEMNAEYQAMNCIPPLAKNANTHLNGASAGIYLFPNDKDKNNEKDKGIFYFHNSGYNFPVVCEHVPFFAGMRARNRRRIYMCTDLVWNWI